MPKTHSIHGFVVALLLLPAFASAKDGCAPPKTSGPLFPSEPGVKEAGKEICNVNGSASGCMKLTFKGKTLYCVVNYMRTNVGAFGVPCELGGGDSGDDQLFDKFSRLVWNPKKKELRFAKLTAPGLTAYSSPEQCGNSIAYWSLEKPPGKPEYEIKAIVFDLRSQAVLKEESLGTSPALPNDFHHFPPPKWSASGTSVSFRPPARGEEKMQGTTLDFK